MAPCRVFKSLLGLILVCCIIHLFLYYSCDSSFFLSKEWFTLLRKTPNISGSNSSAVILLCVLFTTFAYKTLWSCWNIVPEIISLLNWELLNFSLRFCKCLKNLAVDIISKIKLEFIFDFDAPIIPFSIERKYHYLFGACKLSCCCEKTLAIMLLATRMLESLLLVWQCKFSWFAMLFHCNRWRFLILSESCT